MKLLICASISAILTINAYASCEMIKDSDQRAYCRAVEQRSPARCVEIQDHSLRQRCRVELGDSPAQCSTISDPSERAACMSRARR
jgi:hypothetical protein